MSSNIFSSLGANLMWKHLVVRTPVKKYFGKLVYQDDHDNIILLTQDGKIRIQRQFIVAIEEVE
jgi:hypothetical protein